MPRTLKMRQTTRYTLMARLSERRNTFSAARSLESKRLMTRKLQHWSMNSAVSARDTLRWERLPLMPWSSWKRCCPTASTAAGLEYRSRDVAPDFGVEMMISAAYVQMLTKVEAQCTLLYVRGFSRIDLMSMFSEVVALDHLLIC